ncbi:AraC family transcriptional regulator [Paenibacillus silviterrae]|uniref:AraC family transcriptional regulator n=1 Tax=Paenibacillus silviterrae TaxID=3242194 RepID=UPI00254323DD|nr:AraC family transcriptional regulator [Paenibacillus chinjuensis]
MHKYRVVRPTTSLYNLAFIYAGEGVLELDGDLYELGSGCVFHVNPGRRMDLKSSQEQPLQYFGVHFHQLRIQWEGGDYQASFTDTPLPFQRLLALRGHPVHEDIRTMYDCWHVKAAGYEWQTKLGLFQLLNELSNVVITERTLQDSSYRKMESSVRYIRQHYAEPLQRETLAEHADLSVSHYSAMFKKVIGISPLQFVEKVRMDQAKSMLTGTSKPISEIAKDVGYSDPLYFTRVFTKVTGMAPRQYRGG